MEQKFKKLRIFNLVMAGLHFIQGVLMLVLSNIITNNLKTNEHL